MKKDCKIPTRCYLSASTYPFIPKPWILRNDGNNMLLYKLDCTELKYIILSHYQAMILPFFTGKRIFSEIYRAWTYLCGDNVSDEFFVQLINTMYDDGVITTKGDISESFIIEDSLHLPDFTHYIWPSERTLKPVSVMIGPTNRCSTDCIYCYEERMDCPELSLDSWEAVFDELEQEGIRIVDFGGGDPFTRLDIMPLLRSMCRRGFAFFLSTKCAIDEKTAEELRELGIGVPGKWPRRDIQISIDSIIPEIADKMTQVDNYLERTKNSLRALLKNGIMPRVKCVLTPYNYLELEEYVENIANEGVREIQFVQYGRSHYRHDDGMFLKYEQKMYIHNAISAVKQKWNNLSIICQDDLSVEYVPFSPGDWKQRAICTGGRAALCIMPNGDVIPCDQIPHKEEYVVGNIQQNSLLDIWNGEVLDSFLHPPISAFEGTVCASCDEFTKCHYGRGYCYRESLFCYGTIYDAPPSCPQQYKERKRLV